MLIVGLMPEGSRFDPDLPASDALMCTASDWYLVSGRGRGRESMRLSCYHAPGVCLCDLMLFQTLPDFGQ